MEVYIMRHGETHWNRLGLVQGSSDIELTEYGIQLAKETAEGFAERDIHFDHIFTSPYKRAVKTAQCIAENDGITPVVVDDLREMNFGLYEGKSLSELVKTDENFGYCFYTPSKFVADETGESFETVEQRICRFIEEHLLPLEQSKSSVLVVCHGAIIRTFFKVINDMKLDDFWTVKQPNCCVNHFRLEQGKLSLIEGNILYYEPKPETEEDRKKKAGIL